MYQQYDTYLNRITILMNSNHIYNMGTSQPYGRIHRPGHSTNPTTRLQRGTSTQNCTLSNILLTNNFTARYTITWTATIPQTYRNQFVPKQHFHACDPDSIRAPWNICPYNYIIEHTRVGTLCGISVPFAIMVDATFTVANGAWQTRVLVVCG